MSNLGIDFDADLEEVIEDLPSEMTYRGMQFSVISTDLSVEDALEIDGMDEVPEVMFYCRKLPFGGLLPTVGHTVIVDEVTYRVIRAVHEASDASVQLYCSEENA